MGPAALAGSRSSHARARAGPGGGGGAGARQGALQRPAGISSAREEVPARGCVRARERGAARPPRARAGLQPSRDFPAGGGGGRRPFPAPRHGAARGAGRCGPRRRTRPAPLSRPSGADAGKGPGGWRAADGSIPGGSIPRPRRRAGPGPVGAGPGRRRPGARRRVPGTAPPRPSPSPGPPAPRTPQLRETLSSGPARPGPAGRGSRSFSGNGAPRPLGNVTPPHLGVARNQHLLRGCVLRGEERTDSGVYIAERVHPGLA